VLAGVGQCGVKLDRVTGLALAAAIASWIVA
jgi:hypothetical protein